MLIPNDCLNDCFKFCKILSGISGINDFTLTYLRGHYFWDMVH